MTALFLNHVQMQPVNGYSKIYANIFNKELNLFSSFSIKAENDVSLTKSEWIDALRKIIEDLERK
jgi:hypothetical protein